MKKKKPTMVEDCGEHWKYSTPLFLRQGHSHNEPELHTVLIFSIGYIRYYALHIDQIIAQVRSSLL